MAATRRRARADDPSGALEVVKVATPKIARKRLARAMNGTATKSLSQRRRSRIGRASKTSDTSQGGKRQRRLARDEDDAEEPGDDVSENEDSDSPSSGEKRTRASSQSSGSETEREQAQRQAHKQRRKEHQIVVGEAVPLEERVNSRSVRTPPPQRNREPRPVVNCTPYKPQYDPSKLEETLERGYSPISKKVLQKIKWPFKSFVATQRAFFTQDMADEHMKPILYKQLEEGLAGQANRIARKDDGVYVANILRHVRNSASKLRYHVFQAARPVVKIHYELQGRQLPNGGGPEDDAGRAQRVRDLLSDFKFAALDTDTGDGMFEHPAIHDVIASAFFQSTAPTFNIGADERFVDNFKPYPDGLIAFGATAVFAALSEWTSGRWDKGKFEGRAYDTVFEDLLDTLKDMTAGEAEGAAFARKRADWYTTAWSNTHLVTIAQDSRSRNAIVMRNRLSLRAAHTQAEEESAADPSGAMTP